MSGKYHKIIELVIVNLMANVHTQLYTSYKPLLSNQLAKSINLTLCI